jgi:hypothetical protein
MGKMEIGATYKLFLSAWKNGKSGQLGWIWEGVGSLIGDVANRIRGVSDYTDGMDKGYGF